MFRNNAPMRAPATLALADAVDARLPWLLLYAILLFLTIGTAPLFESTEARYGEIAREMVASGNYLEPTFNGILHFHKPPLAYWLAAAGIRLFGPTNFGVRFFGVVAACAAVVMLYLLARTLFAGERKAFAAALIFASSPLFLVISRVASTEIYLTCFTAGAHYFLFRQLFGPRRLGNALGYALCLALGFLTKGPIILLFTLLPFLLAKPFDRGHRAVFSGRQIAAGAALFLAISLPWYLAVVARHPGLLQYFLQIQTVDRVVTNRFNRYQPPWFFVAIFLGTFIPYALFFLRGFCSYRTVSARTRVLLLYIAVPFLVLTLAQGKQAPYILPFYGLAAVVVADFLGARQMHRTRMFAAAVLVVFAAAPAVAGWFFPPLREARGILTVSSLLVAIPVVMIFLNLRSERFLPWMAGTLVLVSTIFFGAAGIAGPEIKGYEKMAATLNDYDPHRNIEVLVLGDLLPSLSFYRGRLAVMALAGERETLFQPDDGYRAHHLTSSAEVRAFLAGRQRVFVVAPAPNRAAVEQEYGLTCREIFAQRKHTAFLCEPAGHLTGHARR
jgi:4-amino-4-deoxy-L-arabinose transferase